MALLIVHAGDFAQLHRDREDGAPERHHRQFQRLSDIQALAKHWRVAVLSVDRPRLEQPFGPELSATGIHLSELTDVGRMRELIARNKADAMVLTLPSAEALIAARLSKIPVLPLFSAYFHRPASWMDRARVLMWRRLLQMEQVPCVANYSKNASLSLVEMLGLELSRVVPWDEPPTEAFGSAKSAPTGLTELLYVGELVHSHGPGDFLQAVRGLQDDGRKVKAVLVGRGQLGPWEAMAHRLGIAAEFPGPLEDEALKARMQAASISVLPMHMHHPEGFTQTLSWMLASGTPVVASRHPGIQGRVVDGVNALYYPPGDVPMLINCCRALMDDGRFYARLSERGAKALPGLSYGRSWLDVVRCFAGDPSNRFAWVKSQSMEAFVFQKTQKKA